MNATDRNTRRPRRVGRSPRKGLTLFELLLALAIFLASLAALAQLLASGSRAAAQAKLQTEAILRCESKLGELVSGIAPITAVAGGTFADDPRWSWQSTAADGPWPNLQLVEVRVSHAGRNSLGHSTYTLRRYVRDPRLFVKSAASRPASLPSRPGRASRSQPSTRPAGSAPGNAESEDSDR